MARQRTSYADRTRKFLKQEKVKYFIGGAVAAYAIKKIAETDVAHDAAVSVTAGFLDLRDSVEEKIENIKEDAADIHSEAQEKQKIEIYGPDDEEEYEEEKIEEE